MLEKDIKRKVLNYLLKELKCFAFVISTTGIYDHERGFFRTGPKRGVPDIIAIYRSKFIGIEIKRKGNKLSPDQEAFRENVKLAGGLFFVIHSVEELKEVWYNKING